VLHQLMEVLETFLLFFLLVSFSLLGLLLKFGCKKRKDQFVKFVTVVSLFLRN